MKQFVAFLVEDLFTKQLILDLVDYSNIFLKNSLTFFLDFYKAFDLVEH